MLLDDLQEEIHVWFALPDHSAADRSAAARASVLSATEQARHERFRFAEDARLYLTAHLLLRNVLSKYCDLSPADWRFRTLEQGRPEIENENTPPIRFNLTHTAGLAACVVTLENDCGIDAERLHKRHHTLKIARRMFSAAECEELQQLSGDARLRRFYSRWTLREALGKAQGIGLRYATDRLSFHLSPPGPILLCRDDAAEPCDSGWHFRLLDPTPQHVAAIAVRNRGGGSLNLVQRQIDPTCL